MGGFNISVPFNQRDRKGGIIIECILDPSLSVVTSGEHARHVIEIMHRCYEAAREGRTVELETTF